MFQNKVNRQYTQGFVGEISQDGPVRAKPGRIVANGAAPNRIGRAFTVVSDVASLGNTAVAIESVFTVGGDGVFGGLLGIPKHYTLYGNSVDGPLGATIDLPEFSEGEFLDMAIMNVAVSNGSDAAGPIPWGAQVWYAKKAGAAATGHVATSATDAGRLYVFSGTEPTDETLFGKVPNAKLTMSSGVDLPPATPNPATGTAPDTGAVTLRAQLTN